MQQLYWICLSIILIAIDQSYGVKQLRSQSEMDVVEEINNLKRKLAATTRKVLVLSEQVDSLQKIVNGLDEAKGRLADYPECPSGEFGFYHIKDLKSCYHFDYNMNLMNATDAQEMCQILSPNSHLVSIESENENNWLMALWKNQFGISQVARFWTSGIRSETDGWQWSHSLESYKFTNWIPTTSHDTEAFSCMAVYSTEAYQWGDVACWAPHAVACEINV